MGVDVPESADTRFGGGAGRPASRVGLAAALGSTGALVAASVLGMALAFAEKTPCRAGAWNSYAGQFQAPARHGVFSANASAMPSTDAATSAPVRPRAAARPTRLAGRPAPPPNRVSADSGTSTPISNRVSLSARLRGLQRAFLVRRSRRRAHRGRPVTTRPTPPATGTPFTPPPPPRPPPPAPPPPVPVVQVTTCGSQE